MRNYLRNIDSFYEGIKELWTLYKFNGSKTWNDEFAIAHKLPNCKKEYYNSLFELQVEPDMDFAINLRKYISEKQKECSKSKSISKKIHENENMSFEELIQNAISLLKSTGEYVIQKKVVTVTLEEV